MTTTPEKSRSAMRAAKWRLANPGKHQAEIQKKTKEYRDIHSTHYKSMMLSRAKVRAQRGNVPFNLNPGDVVIPDICPILGIVLTSGRGKGPKDNSPALDRIIPSLGYVADNIQVISARANRIKSDSTIEELSMILEYLKS
tara:strand:+ start:106 stop:528 length:423 start_codon:yes stop_codon:yes gene_type:complete